MGSLLKSFRVKTVKMADSPDCRSLAAEQQLLQAWLPSMVAYDDDIDIQLDDDEETLLDVQEQLYEGASAHNMTSTYSGRWPPEQGQQPASTLEMEEQKTEPQETEPQETESQEAEPQEMEPQLQIRRGDVQGGAAWREGPGVALLRVVTLLLWPECCFSRRQTPVDSSGSFGTIAQE